MMASGQVISLVPYDLHLSTIQASDLLNVLQTSEPDFVSRLN